MRRHSQDNWRNALEIKRYWPYPAKLGDFLEGATCLSGWAGGLPLMKGDAPCDETYCTAPL
jgi:hypothetical protein